MKRRNFTLSINKDISSLISKVEQTPYYAWIIHDKDINPETGEIIEPHVHVYLEFKNPRSYASVADQLDVAENMVCKVIDKNGILQYLIHKNQPEKYQYNFTDIHANFDLEPFFMDKNDNTLWYDFLDLKYGSMTSKEFYTAHKSQIDPNSFYQKLKIFDLITTCDRYLQKPQSEVK